VTKRDRPTPSPTAETAAHAKDRDTQPPAGQASGASGGYGVGSDRSTGGSGEPWAEGAADEDQATSVEEETAWLRQAPGKPR
jgi:hypothetical protein